MIKTQSAKAKARKLQQFVCSKLQEAFNLEDGDVESCSMGASGVDCKLSPAARKVFPFSLECKKTKKTPARQELNQSIANHMPGTLPAVVWCPHGKGHDASMLMFDFNQFVEFWRDHIENPTS